MEIWGRRETYSGSSFRAVICDVSSVAVSVEVDDEAKSRGEVE